MIFRLLLCLLFVAPVFADPEQRPYVDTSPWNTPIGGSPVYDPNSSLYTSAMTGVLSSDVSRFTMPVYIVDADTPTQTISLSHFYSNVTTRDTISVQRGVSVTIPMPHDVVISDDTDAQLILWDPWTGDEWGFWRVSGGTGNWSAVNGYHYNTRWNGVPPTGFLSRGGGLPYLAGMIRPHEIARGRIDHAIAFAMNYPNPDYIYPATKSDGKEYLPHYMPMGTRLQLDPTLTETDFNRWKLDRAGKIIARALQEYGMILVDGAGNPKIIAEHENTARWNGVIHQKTVRSIPYSAFRVLDLNTPIPLAAPHGLILDEP